MTLQVKAVFLSRVPISAGAGSAGKCSEDGFNQILSSGDWRVQAAHWIDQGRDGNTGWQCLLVRDLSARKMRRSGSPETDPIEPNLGLEHLFAGTVPIPDEADPDLDEVVTAE